jgi:hypothetical protein
MIEVRSRKPGARTRAPFEQPRLALHDRDLDDHVTVPEGRGESSPALQCWVGVVWSARPGRDDRSRFASVQARCSRIAAISFLSSLKGRILF